MGLSKIGVGKKGIIKSLADQPVLTAVQIKEKFDEASDYIIDYLNDVIVDEIEEELGKKAEKGSLSGGKVLVSDNSGKVSESVVTSEEVGYLSTVTRNIQEQLDEKEGKISLSAGYAIISDSEGKVAVSEVKSENLRSITYGREEANNEDGLANGSIYLKVVE